MNSKIFCLALSIVLIVLGGIIVGSVNKTSPSTNDKNIKNSGMGVLVIGLIFFAYGGYHVYEEHGSKIAAALGSSSKPSSGMYYF